jgi:haloalkane dehalogenase
MSADIALPQHQVLNSTMAYREAGRHGAAVALFLHGNPTSSYICATSSHRWSRSRIALLQISSASVNPESPTSRTGLTITCATWMRLSRAGITSAYLVAQDWGTGLAFHLAARRPQFVRGLAFMEFIRPVPTWDEFLQIPAARELFRKFRTPGAGEKLILEDNAFVERVLPGSVIRKLSDEEMAVYRAPFPTSQSRRPILRFPNEIPIAGEPADVYATFEAAHAALARSTYPKLLFAATPGALVAPDFAERFAASLNNCRLVYLGAGAHFLQEDHPETVGRAVAEWIAQAEAASAAPAPLRNRA